MKEPKTDILDDLKEVALSLRYWFKHGASCPEDHHVLGTINRAAREIKELRERVSCGCTR